MSEWVSSAAFVRNDFDSTKPPSADSPTNGDVAAPTVPGSGATPPITLITDYSLRDEDGEIITDENGEAISLEGLEF